MLFWDGLYVINGHFSYNSHEYIEISFISWKFFRIWCIFTPNFPSSGITHFHQIACAIHYVSVSKLRHAKLSPFVVEGGLLYHSYVLR